MQQERQQFSAFVKYEQPPYGELKRCFPAYVSHDYKENERFRPIEVIGNCIAAPLSGDRELVFEYVHPNRDATTTKVLIEMLGLGLRPALYEELLGFAERYPNEQQKHPIIALGSIMGTGIHRRVPCLWDEGRGRLLSTRSLANDWVDVYRFLAVHT